MGVIHQAEHAEHLHAARAALGEDAFAASWAEGRALSAEQAVGYALEHPPGGPDGAAEEPPAPVDSAPEAAPPPSRGGLLSDREIEVLRLVAAGASNQAIAEDLFLSLHTVKRHVANILQKLDAASRTQAVSRARDLGLL
jgi:LuxR family maltose regulon positive regulatory protein